MRGFAHSAASRLAAALLSLALGGVVPWLEAPHAEATHRCQCARGAGHHDCDCPLCHAEAARAAAAATPTAKAPPCHLPKPKREATSDKADKEAAARRAASGPVLASSCGTGDQRFDPPPTVQPFTVPAAPVVAVHVAVARLDERCSPDLGVPVEPETPPPRRA